MGIITTKYDVGDVVHFASYTSEIKQHPCPDCLGAREWSATSPAGGEYKFSCPRCGGGYQSNHELSLNYFQYAPMTRRLTIGLIQPAHNGGVAYMCEETGVGSGQVYDEHSLHETEEAAQVASEAKVAGMNKQPDGHAEKSFNASLRVCDYQLSNALLKSTRDLQISNSVALQILFDCLRDAENISEINEILDGFKWPDQNT